MFLDNNPGPFEDYSECVIQFGFLSLFGAIRPEEPCAPPR